MKRYALSLAIGLLIAPGAIAGDAPAPLAACTQVSGSPHCCAHCGMACACQKSCKIVCEMKEVKKTVWVVHCGEFCTTMPNLFRKCDCGECERCLNGDNCAESFCADCRDGAKCDPCKSLNNRKYVAPDCGRVRGKKTLEKKEVVCKAPSYKCVVEYICGNCGANSNGEGANPADAKAPAPAPAPAPQTKTKTTFAIPLPPVLGTAITAKKG